MAGPLSGLRVIDCSRGMAGTRATGLLADYGADVIWVEPPGGDPFREALKIEYAVFNRGKRSIELDLKSESGREQLFGLLAGADLFVQSWRPGVAERLGLGYEAVHARLPHLVYAAISGFGPDAPHPDLPGYEALVHAHVGTMGEQPGHRTGPIYEGLPFASIGAAYMALIGALGALYRRRDDNIGRRVETSLVDGALAYLSMMWGDTDDAVARPPSQAGQTRLVARTYRCADDEYVGVHTAAVGGFTRLIQALNLQDKIIPSKDGLDVGVPLTPEEARVMNEEIPEIFLSQPRDHWVKLLLEADVCVIPELRPGQVFDEPQPRHNQMVMTLADPELGPLEQVAPAAKFPNSPHAIARPAPRPGQHTAEVLAEAGKAVAKSAAAAPAGPGAADRPLLDGLKILDLGAYYAGPYSSRLLADLGADVIKLEPTYGDLLRGLDRPFRSAQAGKRAIAANLKEADLQQARARLLEWADVSHHNMRPGAAERLGMGAGDQRKANARGLYMYAPGWGSSGPDKDRQSFAPLLSGYAGVSYECGGQFNPPIFPLGNEDPGNGLVGAIAALIGLLQRERTGEGDYIENPQVNATMSHMAHVVRQPDGTVLNAERLDPLQRGLGPLDRLYETADGWICVVALRDPELEALTHATGVPILGNPQFASAAARQENADALADQLENAFATRGTDDWLAALRAAGAPAMVPKPYNNIEFMRDAKNQASRRVGAVPHPRHGTVRELSRLVRVSHCTPVPHKLAPALGEHTDSILGWLGYDAGRIAALRAKGAIR
ncbi:MAG: CaiB/BaiF CoA transferase family protein [Gammaproteobacteria bacterium]